ncbi:hypothetical protein PHABIO_10 [Pseudomonas phage Phabio]|uniref:Uncharacterized protein n=1 Tax=Pseudomonas phage Phabio TaxID=2006668 RepID=A0A1Y0ST31_9CAUD|nr:hypothetical protein MZD05_gp010 [Pseudomonas phage Phabio]ARV76641.1 hypothetical protein PHABIO_10 [Pseudomonas phage Phabio]
MKTANLSTLNDHYAIEITGEDGPEYWAHSDIYIADITHEFVGKFNKQSVGHWLDWHTRRGINARAVPVSHHHTLVKWPDYGWVVIVPNGRESSVHKAYLAGTYGDGWFMKDEGTTERLLCMNIGEYVYWEMKVQGKNLGDLTVIVEGDRHVANSFNIPTDSDLSYQFTFDVNPVELV